MSELLRFVDQLLHLYTIILFAAVIVQLLVQTGSISYSPMLRSIHGGLMAVTEPLLAPIRRRMPRMSVDFSPLVLFLAIWFTRDVVLTNVAKAVA